MQLLLYSSRLGGVHTSLLGWHCWCSILQYTVLKNSVLHYIVLQYAVLQYIVLQYIVLEYAVFEYSVLHCIVMKHASLPLGTYDKFSQKGPKYITVQAILSSLLYIAANTVQ